MLGAARGDGEAAVARHHRGHPVVGGRLELGIPEDLGVEVGVDVDEARGHHAPRCIQLHRPVEVLTDGLDQPAGDGHVGHPTGLTRAIDDGATADYQIS
jgi:hypothetical protein